jgi:hypothetical protein
MRLKVVFETAHILQRPRRQLRGKTGALQPPAHRPSGAVLRSPNDRLPARLIVMDVAAGRAHLDRDSSSITT